MAGRTESVVGLVYSNFERCDVLEVGRENGDGGEEQTEADQSV